MSEWLEHFGHPCQLPEPGDKDYCENCGDLMDGFSKRKCSCGRLICKDCALLCDACEEAIGCRFCFQTLTDGNFCETCIDLESEVRFELIEMFYKEGFNLIGEGIKDNKPYYQFKKDDCVFTIIEEKLNSNQPSYLKI